MKNYLDNFSSLDNNSFSQEEMIEIMLNIIPLFWIKIMATVGIDTRRKSYEELIVHLKGWKYPFQKSSPKKEKTESQISEKNEIPRK